MSQGFDLQVDTGSIRRAAAALEETGHRLRSAAPGAGPSVGPGALGSDAGAVAAARLVALRCAQGQQAADQLGAVASGMSHQLTLCANTFDRMETTSRWPR